MLAKIKGLMSVVGGVVFGGLVGIVASGGVPAWLGWRRGKRAREAAALAVLGDLYAWGSMLELILDRAASRRLSRFVIDRGATGRLS